MLAPALFDLTGEDAIVQGATWSYGFQIWGDDVGDWIDTSDMTARFKVRATDFDGDVAVEGTTEDGRIVLGWSPNPVARNQAYVLGARVIPVTGPNGYLYEATVAGTSHASNEPTWPTVLAGTVSDGTVTWENIGPDHSDADNEPQLTNAYILLSASYTASLVDWGQGRWDFELIDGSTVMRLFEGYARLSREVTY